MKKKMTLFDPYIARLIEIARAYYLEDKTQAEIASSLGISRSMVSRELAAARDLGMVEIRIVGLNDENSQLANALCQRFPRLKEVIVAPTFSRNEEALRAMIGRFAANYLLEILKPNQRLVLGCGRTLRAMVEALPRKEIPGVSVVQAMGNIGHEVYKIDYNEISRQAAEALGGQVYYVSAPAILGIGSGPSADLIRANPSLEVSLTLAAQADVYLFGLGSLESDQVYARAGLIQQPELDDLRGRAVGDVYGHFFDLHGQQQPSAFEERIVGVSLDHLRYAPYAVAVAGGPDKAEPLLGALRGGLISVLISDAHTLQQILELDAKGANL